MNSELDKKLCERFPKLLANRTESKSVSPFHYGFECGDGWYNILLAAFTMIHSHVSNHNREVDKLREYKSLMGTDLENTVPQWALDGRLDNVAELMEMPKVDQVKEKFGTLRLYIDGADDIVDTIVIHAELMSGVVCEKCGCPGERRSGGWIRTLCDKHYQEQEDATSKKV